MISVNLQCFLYFILLQLQAKFAATGQAKVCSTRNILQTETHPFVRCSDACVGSVYPLALTRLQGQWGFF